MPRWLSPGCLWCALALLVGAAPALAQIALQGQVITGGGGRSLSPAGCYRLDGSLGEPAAGRQSGAAFAVEAGYWAGPGAHRSDALFRHGFEECL